MGKKITVIYGTEAVTAYKTGMLSMKNLKQDCASDPTYGAVKTYDTFGFKQDDALPDMLSFVLADMQGYNDYLVVEQHPTDRKKVHGHYDTAIDIYYYGYEGVG